MGHPTGLPRAASRGCLSGGLRAFQVMAQGDSDVLASSGATRKRVAGRERVGADHRGRASIVPTEKEASDAQLRKDKTWFVLLLVLGILSFGLVAMIAYVIAGPDGTRRPTATTPELQASA